MSDLVSPPNGPLGPDGAAAEIFPGRSRIRVRCIKTVTVLQLSGKPAAPICGAVMVAEPVLIVDDDAGFRSLLCELLARAGYPIRETASGEEALDAASADRPRLVVLDVCLPGLSGYEVCCELRERFGEDLPILFVSGKRVEALDRVAGILVGGDDYLVKPFALDEFLARVRRLTTRSAAVAARCGLTARELDILRLLADGLGSTEIARRLTVSSKTVDKHIEHILAKLGVHKRAHAVARAYREGLLEPEIRSVGATAGRQ